MKVLSLFGEYVAVQLPSTFKRRGIIYKPFFGAVWGLEQAKDVKELGELLSTTRTQKRLLLFG